MRIVITGSPTSSTPGHKIGSWLFRYFEKDNEVIQLSRSTGYDFEKNYNSALEIAKTADVFVNNACIKDYQYKFLTDLYGKVPKIISLGSIAADFSMAIDSEYSKIKKKLKDENRIIPLRNLNLTSDLLHFTITETEDINKNGITYDQFSKILTFWFENPIFTNVDLKFFVDQNYLMDEKNNKITQVLKYYGNNQN